MRPLFAVQTLALKHERTTIDRPPLWLETL